MTELKCISGVVQGKVQCPYCGYTNDFVQTDEESVDIRRFYMVGLDFCSVDVDIRSTCGNCHSKYKVKCNISSKNVMNDK